MLIETGARISCEPMRILIAEDDEKEAEELYSIFKPVASYLAKAHNMIDLLQLVRTEQFDLIAFDLDYTVTRIKQIKEAQPGVILIVIAGAYEPGMEKLLTEAGADGIIKKTPENSTPREFLRAVKEIVDSIQKLPSHLKQVTALEKAVCRITEYYNQLNQAVA